MRHYKRYWNVAPCLSILQYMSQRRENRGRWVGVMQTTSIPGKEQRRKWINKVKTVEKGSSLGDVQTWTLKAAWRTFLVLFMINVHYLLLILVYTISTSSFDINLTSKAGLCYKHKLPHTTGTKLHNVLFQHVLLNFTFCKIWACR